MAGGLKSGSNWGLISRGIYPGSFYPGVIFSDLYPGGLYPGAYIPHCHTDSEQVNKRLSPTNLKELHSRFTSLSVQKAKLIGDSICARGNSC